jgi:quinol monooxygenase YgiN
MLKMTAHKTSIKQGNKNMRLHYLVCAVIMAAFIMPPQVSAQSNSNYIRIAKLTIDSAKLEHYNQALKEHAEAAVRVEPGVLMLYAVYEKERPTHVSVFEIYANVDAYNFHIKTPHFLKYKATVQDMVKSLELIDVSPIALEAKSQSSK